MRISRFLTFVGIITLACLVYIWQQVKLIEINYGLLKKEKQLTKLIDQNRILKYNALRMKSPQVIEKRLTSSNIKLKYTSPILMTQLDKATVDVRMSNDVDKKSFLENTRKALSRVFSLKSQVEAIPPAIQ